MPAAWFLSQDSRSCKRNTPRALTIHTNSGWLRGMNERIWGTLDPFFEPGPILGRKVANTWFLRAFLRADPFDAYHFFPGSGAIGQWLLGRIQKEFPEIAHKVRVMDRRELPGMLAAHDYFCFHQSDCVTLQPMLAALRNEVALSCFPITGTIHSLSYQDYAELFLRHLSPGTTARDAIVCTSTAGREVVCRLFTLLRENYGLAPERFFAPFLAHIPLGVDVQDFACRKHISECPCRFLVFGRISHFSKMDLLPVLRAFQRLFADGLARESVCLVLAGWVEDGDDFLPTFQNLARNIGLPLEVIKRPTAAEKKRLFVTSDVFVSVADNPQETFGLTILEAAAAGLPAIVSDYDGYRDLVLDGLTGIFVPTIGPLATPQVNRMAPLTFDSDYHLTLAQQTAVSVPKLAEAILELAGNVDMRRNMGQAARHMVQSTYTDQAVITRYLALWEELRKHEVHENFRCAGHPSRMDYGRLFGHYTTMQLDNGLTVQTGRTGWAVYRGREHIAAYAGVERHVLPEHARLIAFLARKPVSCGELIAELENKASLSAEAAHYAILWALKHDILERG